MPNETHYHTPGPVETDLRAAISPVEEIIEEARNGRMYILVDHEDRENEGDLIIPAQMATPEAVNFMAMKGRGLICLCLSSERVDRLGLPLMTSHNASRHETAFTVSIEAREGIETGISARDRARTVAVAIDSSKGAADIVSPGHVFPLRARDGGVLVRAGHTEAAVDISRLAGLNPSGVICEIMREDGTMARLSDLVTFARLHDLKIGTIRDLIAYRRKHDRMVEMQREYSFESKWGGQWRARVYFNSATQEETIVLVKGHVIPETPTLVRMHTLAFFPDIFGELGTRASLLSRSMEIIAEEGNGVIVVLNKPLVNSFAKVIDLKLGLLQGKFPKMEDMRDYGVGAQILAELGIHDMVLLTNTEHSLVALEGYGLNIVGQRPFD